MAFEPSPLMLTADRKLRPTWGFLLFHEAVRRDAMRFRQAAERWSLHPPVVPFAFDALQAHWRHYVALLEYHHSMEDNHLFPAMRSAVPELAPLIDRLDEEHQELDALLERIHTSLEARAVAELAHDFAALESLLLRHLAAEEEHVVPAFLRVLEAASTETSSRSETDNAPAQAPEAPVPPAFDLPWSLEQLDGELFRLAIATFPDDQQAAYETWLEQYREMLKRWAP